MKRLEVKVSYPQCVESKLFTIILPDYFTGEALYAILKFHKNKRYNISVKERDIFSNPYIECSSIEALIDAVKQVRLWIRTEKKIWGDVEETVLETVELHLYPEMIIKEVSFNRNCGYDGEGITFFRVYLEANKPFDISFACYLNPIDGFKTKYSRNNFCYISGQWKFIKDDNDPTLWKAIRYEKKRDIIGKEVSLRQV